VKNENYEGSYNHFLQLVVGDNSENSNNNNNNNSTTVTSKGCNARKYLYGSRVNATGMCNVKVDTIQIYLTFTFLKSRAISQLARAYFTRKKVFFFPSS
jgi:hypothetical protein